MQLGFTKMHGLGNDFIVYELPQGIATPDSQVLRRLADRRTGIGFDQALQLEPPRRSGTDVFYRIFNADGSEVEQCGNGARCIAQLVAQRLDRSDELIMDSPGGLVRARLQPDGLVAVAMGIPDFDPASLPFAASSEAAVYPLEAAGVRIEIGAVSIGNPHAVLRVPDVDAAPVDRLGPAVENHARFPRRTNVGFMQVLDRHHIRLRVHERGTGETRACGTGACAAVAVGRRHGLLDERVDVDLPGGRLRVEWKDAADPIWLTGPAETAFTGRVDI